MAESFFSSLKKERSASTKPVFSFDQMYLIVSKLFSIEPDATAISVALVIRRLRLPQIDARECLPICGKSRKAVISLSYLEK